MLKDNVYEKMKCVIHTGKESKEAFRAFQEERISLAIKQIRNCDPDILKMIRFDEFELPQAA